MTLQNRLEILGKRLNDLPITNVFHYHRAVTEAPFLTWQEQTEDGSFYADDDKMQSVMGTVDYYTDREYDSIIDQIQLALNDVVSWELQEVSYEEETELIHYVWAFVIEEWLKSGKD